MRFHHARDPKLFDFTCFRQILDVTALREDCNLERRYVSCFGMGRSVLLAILVSLAPISMAAQSKPYAKPQVQSATGKPAPDFTLNDQDAKPFTLSHQHGKWVLLYFYRGFW